MYPTCPQESVGNYVKGMSMPDVSESGFFHTCGNTKEISRTGSPILDRMALGKPRMKNIFAGIVRS